MPFSSLYKAWARVVCWHFLNIFLCCSRTIVLCHTSLWMFFCLIINWDMWREASHPCVLSWSNPGPWSAESAQISCCLSRFLDNPGEDNGQVCVAAWHCVIPAVVLGGSLIDLMRCCSEKCICMLAMLWCWYCTHQCDRPVAAYCTKMDFHCHWPIQ